MEARPFLHVLQDFLERWKEYSFVVLFLLDPSLGTRLKEPAQAKVLLGERCAIIALSRLVGLTMLTAEIMMDAITL